MFQPPDVFGSASEGDPIFAYPLASVLLARTFSERHHLEFRLRVRSSSLIGRITSAGDPRILQLGSRYSF
jgi:hypothetical protein